MNSQGLTLSELLIALAIAAILAAAATPAFTDLLRRQQVRGEIDLMWSLVYFARSEAIKRNAVVTVCKSDDGEYCGGSWSDGWIVFQDHDRDGERDNGEPLIDTGRTGEGYRLSWTAFGSDNYIRFMPSGLTMAQNGTFVLCPQDGDVRYARALVISKTARARMPEDSNGDGVYEDASGNNLSCG